MKKIFKWMLAVIIIGIIQVPLNVSATSLRNNPHITFSPDNQAFTTDAGEENYEVYGKGHSISTGIASNIRQLGAGEHYYRSSRQGIIPVGRWEVVWEPARCIHNAYPEDDAYHQVPFGRNNCFRRYRSGWLAYCADCGERITSMFFYMNERTARTIRDLDMSLRYYYLCPNPACNNLEQGADLGKHMCNSISWNRYYVKYDANFAKGTMLPSTFMYNNATQYEGEAVTPATHLTFCNFSREGYEFMGWNTKADGSGTSYSDGQKIKNLTDQNNTIITLYAQWKKSTSTLHIDPVGGTYKGSAAITSLTNDYGKKYSVDTSLVQPPKGHLIHFETFGGSTVEDMVTPMSFLSWLQGSPFGGLFIDNVYTYKGHNGSEDTLRASYQDNPITLPGTTRPDAQFGGWFRDQSCTVPVGTKGDTILFQENTTLYAKWTTLALTGKDNYGIYGGSGAVDLSWKQEDALVKTYKLYQSLDRQSWSLLSQTTGMGEAAGVDVGYGYTGTSEHFCAPYTGKYTITADGAQGQNYGGNSGGLGGRTAVSVWLAKGETVTVCVGGQNSYNGGGAGSPYGNGGGKTTVSTDRKGLLLVAGGGGGASSLYGGGNGGLAESLISGGNGGSGGAGGGGGYQGGSAGAAVQHYHTGNSSSGGGCYGQSLVCGGSIASRTEGGGQHFHWAGSNTVYCPACNSWNTDKPSRCGKCGQMSACSGHDTAGTTVYYCTRCGSNYGGSNPGVCKQGSGYAQNCAYAGRPDGYVISAYPAYGGTSYVNPAACAALELRAGANAGNGKVQIVLASAEYFDSLSQPGVKAKDLASPDAIGEKLVTRTALSSSRIRLSWNRPGDNGTAYYHRAESYGAENGMKLCDSNITVNTLTSGIAGYYYILDENPDTQASQKNGKYITETAQEITLTAEKQYFHVAAVDVAGNRGETAHIQIGSADEAVAWLLKTTPIRVDMTDNVYGDQSRPETYYVRADGETPFQLSFDGQVQKDSSGRYQVNRLIFDTMIEGSGKDQKYQVYAPSHIPAVEGEVVSGLEELKRSSEGEGILQEGAYSVVTRSNKCLDARIDQKFLLDRTFDGIFLQIVPVVGADFGTQAAYSMWEEDVLHGIWLIGDATPPEVYGAELLAALPQIDRDNEEVQLELTCADSGSGVKEFYVDILNTDNYVQKKIGQDADGKLRLDITKDEPVYNGDFTVTIHAIDNVGNDAALEYSTCEYSLKTSIERILTPHDPVFKRGESGILHIKTLGYIDRLEVIFPKVFLEQAPQLNRTYVYDVPDYLQEEELKFMVPVYGIEDGEYTITVKAYKKGTQMEDHPRLNTITVSGTILDELRTRLR